MKTNRRGFLKFFGGGAAGAAVVALAPKAQAAAVDAEIAALKAANPVVAAVPPALGSTDAPYMLVCSTGDFKTIHGRRLLISPTGEIIE